MLRRSLRLLEAGYYTAEGNPRIFYGETVYRIFRRRRHPNLLDRSNFDNTVGASPMFDQDEHFTSRVPGGWKGCEVNDTQISRVQRNTAKCILHMWDVSRFLFPLLLACGVLHVHLQLEAVERELVFRRRQMEACCPVADTMANFALHSQGASVVKGLSSDMYGPAEHNIWKRMYCWLLRMRKENVLLKGDSVLRPEERRCFPGDNRRLVIALSKPIFISRVTLGHITKSQSPGGYIGSAPRMFSIYGMKTSADEGCYLGTGVYDENGPGLQTFVLPSPDSAVFSHVKIYFLSNWGNSEHTCIYAVRVHGKLPETPAREHL